MPWASSADSVFSSAVFSRDNLSKIAATLALPSLVYAFGFAPHFSKNGLNSLGYPNSWTILECLWQKALAWAGCSAQTFGYANKNI